MIIGYYNNYFYLYLAGLIRKGVECVCEDEKLEYNYATEICESKFHIN